MQICQLDAAGLWTGETRDIGEHDPVPHGWVAVAPPAGLPEGDTARYTLAGWVPVTASDATAARSASAPLAPRIESVSRRQARLALLSAGLLGAVEAAIAALPEPQRSFAQIEWADAQILSRDHPLLLMLATTLGLTEADIDALFLEASRISFAY